MVASLQSFRSFNSMLQSSARAWKRQVSGSRWLWRGKARHKAPKLGVAAQSAVHRLSSDLSLPTVSTVALVLGRAGTLVLGDAPSADVGPAPLVLPPTAFSAALDAGRSTVAGGVHHGRLSHDRRSWRFTTLGSIRSSTRHLAPNSSIAAPVCAPYLPTASTRTLNLWLQLLLSSASSTISSSHFRMKYSTYGRAYPAFLSMAHCLNTIQTTTDFRDEMALLGLPISRPRHTHVRLAIPSVPC
jgi:hypothetical protein